MRHKHLRTLLRDQDLSSLDHLLHSEDNLVSQNLLGDNHQIPNPFLKPVSPFNYKLSFSSISIEPIRKKKPHCYLTGNFVLTQIYTYFWEESQWHMCLACRRSSRQRISVIKPEKEDGT